MRLWQLEYQPLSFPSPPPLTSQLTLQISNGVDGGRLRLRTRLAVLVGATPRSQLARLAQLRRGRERLHPLHEGGQLFPVRKTRLMDRFC